MGLYKIEWKHSAQRELRKLGKEVILKILEVVQSLAENPYPRNYKKLEGSEHSYRIRVGEYRIIYTIQSSLLIIEIIRVGHRKDVYKKFT